MPRTSFQRDREPRVRRAPRHADCTDRRRESGTPARTRSGIERDDETHHLDYDARGGCHARGRGHFQRSKHESRRIGEEEMDTISLLLQIFGVFKETWD
jgi:hypothetical protein